MKIWKILFISLFVCLFPSCQKDQFGYDKKVYIPAAGGEIVVSGNEPVQNLSILDYYGEGNHSQNTLEEPEIQTSYLWLTAKTVPFSTSITLVAEPNTSGKSRTLYVYGAIRNGHTNIKVIQE